MFKKIKLKIGFNVKTVPKNSGILFLAYKQKSSSYEERLLSDIATAKADFFRSIYSNIFQEYFSIIKLIFK